MRKKCFMTTDLRYQKFGSPDHDKTLVNRIFTSFCWACMVALATGVADVTRYILGPLPPFLCSLVQFTKYTVRTEILLFYNAMALSRYVLIFVLKNPMAVDDKFWNLFISIAITLASFVINLGQGMTATQQDSAYYICCSLDPKIDSGLPKKQEGFILNFTLILQIVVNARILVHKHRQKLKKLLKKFKFGAQEAANVGGSDVNDVTLTIDKSTIVNTSAICWALIFSAIFYRLNVKVKSFSVEEINLYPNYLSIYVLQLISFQLFGLVMLATLFVKHKKMVKILYDALTE